MKKLIKPICILAVCVFIVFAFASCLTTNETGKKSNDDNIIQVEQSVSSSKGTVVEIYYPTRDYTIDEKDLTDADRYTKHAFVYLPAGYDANDKDTKYPVIILMHGGGGNEYTWGLPDENGEIRSSLDNGIASGKVKKCIVVTPCGVADKTWRDNSNGSSRYGTINFGKELRDDLLPYLRANFNIADGRENVAMAGFSMGAEQTMGIGIQQSLDIISYFGAFSSIPFSIPSDPSSPFKQPADYMKAVEETFPDKNLKAELLYMTCGTNDEFATEGYNAYIKELPKWDKIEKFEKETIDGAGHDWNVWVNGFDHFIQMVFKSSLTTNDTDKKSNGNDSVQVGHSVSDSKGSVVEIYYPTRDYTIEEKNLTDVDRYEKHAFVYLPAGYDPNDTKTKYPIIFLMHGNGANEYTWGLPDEGSEIRRSLDNGIASGKVKKCIVVTPCGVADKTWQDNSNGSSWFGTINFAGELHNDLIPYMKQHFNILEGRENFAMAGFSMGAEQSLGVGIQQSLSTFSYFGAFSAIPFSIPSDITSPFKQPADYMKAVEEAFPDKNLKIKLLYMTCGTNDEFMYQGYSAYIKELPKWSKIEKFKEETIEGAGHDWNVWVNGFDHFIQMVFK